jgi:phage gp37-like protein
MNTLRPFPAIPQPRRVLHYLAVESQLGSRWNAMIASTALAQRRAERIEVEEFFAGLEEATAATAVRG